MEFQQVLLQTHTEFFTNVAAEVQALAADPNTAYMVKFHELKEELIQQWSELEAQSKATRESLAPDQVDQFRTMCRRKSLKPEERRSSAAEPSRSCF